MENHLLALALAVQHDDVHKVVRLVEFCGPQGILCTRMPFASMGTVLHVCAEWGSLKTLKELVRRYGHEHFDVSIPDIEGNTALHNLVNWRAPQSSPTCFKSDVERVASLLLQVLDHGTTSANELLAVQNSHGDLTALCKALAYKKPIIAKAILAAAKDNLEEAPNSIESEETGNNVAMDSHWLVKRARGWRIGEAYSLGDRGYDHQTASYVNDPFCTALHLAVLGKYDEIVARILEYSSRAPCLTSLQDHDGNTPLHVAAKVGHVGICTSLLKYDKSRYGMEYNMVGGGDYQQSVVAKNNKGETPVHIASTFGHAELGERLFQYYASVSTQDYRGRYAAINAHFRYAEDNTSSEGHDEAVKKLLDACIPTSIPACSGGEATAGKSDQRSSDNPDPKERLINEPFAFGFTPLHVAVASSSENHIDSLLAAGAMLQSVSHSGRTPLHVAADIYDQISLSKLLHAPGKWINNEKKKWINAKDDNGQTALYKVLQLPSSSYSITVSHHVGETTRECDIAATHNQYEKINAMVRELLKEEAWVDVQDSRGETALHAAVRLHHSVVLTLLSNEVTGKNFRKGAGFHSRNKWICKRSFSGESALHVAAKLQNADSVLLLLKSMEWPGILARLRDMNDKTALDWAATQIDRAATQTYSCDNMIRTLICEDTFNDGLTGAFLVWHLRKHLDDDEYSSFCTNYKVKVNAAMLLLRAACKRNVDVTRELINSGVDVTLLHHVHRDWLAEMLGEIPSDMPTVQDALGRRKLVQGVATLLLSAYTQTPITIGIFGSWGAGKSSFMLQVETAMLCMVVKETFKKTTWCPEIDGSKFTTQFSRPGAKLRSLVINALVQRTAKTRRFCEETIVNVSRTELLQNDRQFFKNLALTDRSKLVQSYGGARYEKWFRMLTQSFRDTRQILYRPSLLTIAYMPSLLTVHYNAWQYNDKNEAVAGLAVEISKQLESFMTPDQWLRMSFKHSWKRYSHKIFLQIFYPILLTIVAFAIIAAVWELTHLSTKSKTLALGTTILALALGFFRAFVQVIQPVTQSLHEMKSFMNHQSMRGYQHQVIEDINFLKSELCEETHVGWKFLGILFCLFLSKSYYMEGTWIPRQHPLPNNFRIVVFIDDLDRCDEKTILEVLRAVDLVLGSCKINVVIGVDEGIVHRALNKEFSQDVGKKSSDEWLDKQRWSETRDPFADDKSPNTQELAEKYLQKIIHLPIQLPDPSRKDLRSFLDKQVGLRYTWRSSSTWEFKKNKWEYEKFEEGVEDINECPGIFNFKLLVATYTINELLVLKKLRKLATSEKRGPREWKRYMNYHRLAWTILSQDQSMKEPHFKSWQLNLALWIFICWNWRDEMDEIFQNWNVLISDVFKRHEQSILQGRGRVDEEEIQLSNIVDECMARKEESLRKNNTEIVGNQEDKVVSNSWVGLAAILKEYGIPLHFIVKFQQFRFCCVSDHLEIDKHLTREEGELS